MKKANLIDTKQKYSLSNYAAESAVTALPHMFRPQSTTTHF